jgi:hypothetical protein
MYISQKTSYTRRPADFTLKDGTAPENQAAYNYDAFSRLSVSVKRSTSIQRVHECHRFYAYDTYDYRFFDQNGLFGAVDGESRAS